MAFERPAVDEETIKRALTDVHKLTQHYPHGFVSRWEVLGALSVAHAELVTPRNGGLLEATDMYGKLAGLCHVCLYGMASIRDGLIT